MEERRTTVVPVRLNDAEALRMDEARRPKGLARSAYLRMALLEKLDRDGRAERETTAGEV